MTDTEQTKKTPEAEKKAAESRLSAIRGCIFGGAVGDALGYPVEFLDDYKQKNCSGFE